MLTSILRNAGRETFTTLLDLIGLALIVAAFAVWFGLAAALAASGVSVLAVSVSLAWPRPRR